MSAGKTILIRGTNWIGDSVMSLAAIRELRRLFPTRHVALLATPWVADLFKNQELVDSLIVPEQTSGLQSLVRWPRKIRHFDTAVLFQNAFHAALVAYLARIPERLGYNTDGRGWLLTRSAQPRIKELRRHQIYYYLDLLYQTGLSDVDYLSAPEFTPDIRLTAPPGAVKRARALLASHGLTEGRPLLVVNPGAYYGDAKRWFADRFAALADRLIEKDHVQVAVVGSARESRIAQEIAGLMKRTPCDLTGQTDLASLIGVLQCCDLLLTNDSGPMHLAAALEVPQIALFGSTDETATGPLSDKAQVIHKHVECSPCLLRECPIDLRCFTQIGVDEVYRAAQAVLGKQ